MYVTANQFLTDPGYQIKRKCHPIASWATTTHSQTFPIDGSSWRPNSYKFPSVLPSKSVPVLSQWDEVTRREGSVLLAPRVSRLASFAGWMLRVQIKILSKSDQLEKRYGGCGFFFALWEWKNGKFCMYVLNTYVYESMGILGRLIWLLNDSYRTEGLQRRTHTCVCVEFDEAEVRFCVEHLARITKSDTV